jgi:hypothetical protein
LIGTCSAAADDGGWWFLQTQLVVTVLIGLPAAVIDGVRYIKAAV